MNFRSTRHADITLPLVIDEVNALIRYASEKGIDPPGPDPQKAEETTLVLLTNAVKEYEAADAANKADKQPEVLRYYAQLVRATKLGTFEINGRTLLDTQSCWQDIAPILFLTIILLATAIGNEVLVSWLSEQVIPEEGWPLFWANLQQHFLQYLMPFVWGGLGACVYLSKGLYDFAQYRAFDRTKVHGIYLRVVLGAVLAAVVLYLFDPTVLSDDDLPLDYKAIAFLVGLGVKVVYGALEKLVNVLAEKFSLGALRREPAQQNDVRAFISKQLSDPVIAKDEKSKAVLVALLQEYEKNAKTGS